MIWYPTNWHVLGGVQGEIARIQTKGRASTPVESAKEESDRHETRNRKFEIQTMHLVAGIHEKRPITKSRNQQVQKRHQQIQQNVGQIEKVRFHLHTGCDPTVQLQRHCTPFNVLISLGFVAALQGHERPHPQWPHEGPEVATLGETGEQIEAGKNHDHQKTPQQFAKILFAKPTKHAQPQWQQPVRSEKQQQLVATPSPSKFSSRSLMTIVWPMGLSHLCYIEIEPF